MAQRRPLPPAAREAAERLITALVDDEAFASFAAEAKIAADVAAGLLVPAEKLSIGGGLVLAPAGRIAELERAVQGAIAALSLDTPSVDDALLALHMATPASEPEPTADTEPAGDTKEAAPDEAPDEPEPEEKHDKRLGGKRGPKAVELEVEKTGRPVGQPDPTVDHPCADCDVMVPGKQASLVWSRFRRVLCEDCVAP